MNNYYQILMQAYANDVQRTNRINAFDTTSKSLGVFESTLKTYLIQPHKDCFKKPIRLLDIMSGYIPYSRSLNRLVNEAWGCEHIFFIDKYISAPQWALIEPRISELKAKQVTYLIDDFSAIDEKLNGYFNLVTNIRPNTNYLNRTGEHKGYNKLPELMAEDGLFIGITYDFIEMNSLKRYIKKSGLKILKVQRNKYDKLMKRYGRIITAVKSQA